MQIQRERGSPRTLSAPAARGRTPTPKPKQTRRRDGKHVVFGAVTKGMAVVRKMEAAGSQAGQTKRAVVIADCGQLMDGNV